MLKDSKASRWTSRWKIIRIILLVLLLWVLLNAFLPTLTSEEFRALVESRGLMGPIIIIAYTILEDIIAPLSGLPAFVASAAVYGLFKTEILLYIATMASACINFFISKKFGRKVVRKLAGQDTLEHIDTFAEHFGTKILILGRLFGFALFDGISYAAGLTAMSFKQYIVITAVFSLISRTIVYFVFRTTDFTSAQGILTLLGVLFIASLIFLFLFKKHVHSKAILNQE